jgi:uncharacterized protein (TIGR03089 family)
MTSFPPPPSPGAELGSEPFAALQARRVAEYGDRPFLTWYDDGRSERVELSYKTFDNWVQKVANLLAEEYGVERGDRVALVTGEHWQASAVCFACWMVGACAVPVDPDEPPEGKASILAAAGARIAFVREEYLDEVKGLGLSPLTLIALVADLFGNAAVELGGTPSFSRIVPGMPDVYDGGTGGFDDPALTILASGTSAPAGVTLSAADLLVRGAAITRRWQVTELDRTLGHLAAHDVDGLVTTHLVPFGAGAGTVLNRGFNPATLWKRVADEKVSVLSLTSIQVERVLDSEAGAAGLDLGRLRMVVYDAGRPPDEIAARWNERFGIGLATWSADGGTNSWKAGEQ